MVTGASNDGYPPEVAYRHFPFDGVTINGLVIGGAEDIGDLQRYFRSEVIRGPGAFVMVAQKTIGISKRRCEGKLEREVAPRAVSTPKQSLDAGTGLSWYSSCFRALATHNAALRLPLGWMCPARSIVVNIGCSIEGLATALGRRRRCSNRSLLCRTRP